MIDLSIISSSITVDELPASIQQIARDCGMPDAVALLQHFPGIQLYIPRAGKEAYRRHYIAKNYQRNKALSIAVKLKIDAARVHEIARQLEKNPPHNDDLMPNDTMRLVAERCGIDASIRLMEHFPGQTIYIPREGLVALLRRYVIKAFGGSNATRIAADIGMSERWVRKVIADDYYSRQQLSLFA